MDTGVPLRQKAKTNKLVDTKAEFRLRFPSGCSGWLATNYGQGGLENSQWDHFICLIMHLSAALHVRAC